MNISLNLGELRFGDEQARQQSGQNSDPRGETPLFIEMTGTFDANDIEQLAKVGLRVVSVAFGQAVYAEETPALGYNVNND